jgi:hypothetical protein
MVDELTQEAIEKAASEKAATRNKAFMAAFDDWLRTRTDPGAEETGEESEARNSREDDLALQILMTPTDVDWRIFRKFEVIDYILTMYGEATWAERRALTALDAIKADLLRFLNPVPDGS